MSQSPAVEGRLPDPSSASGRTTARHGPVRRRVRRPPQGPPRAPARRPSAPAMQVQAAVAQPASCTPAASPSMSRGRLAGKLSSPCSRPWARPRPLLDAASLAWHALRSRPRPREGGLVEGRANGPALDGRCNTDSTACASACTAEAREVHRASELEVLAGKSRRSAGPAPVAVQRGACRAASPVGAGAARCTAPAPALKDHHDAAQRSRGAIRRAQRVRIWAWRGGA